jgi:hypothetical protein
MIVRFIKTMNLFKFGVKLREKFRNFSLLYHSKIGEREREERDP